MKDVKQIFSQNLTKINLKTNSFLEINKLNTYISSIQKEIDELQKKLTGLLCDSWRENRSIPEQEAAAILDHIMEKEALIEEQKAKIEEIRESETLILGERRENMAAGASGTEVVYCPECGAANTKNSKFCRQCGKRIEYTEGGEE